MTVTTIDPKDPSFFIRDDFHELLAKCRKDQPIGMISEGEFYVSRYDDIRAISRDPTNFVSSKGVLVNDALRGSPGSSTPSFLQMDPPIHGKFRDLVKRRFTPRSLQVMKDRIEVLARNCLDEIDGRDDIEFVSALAAPFPLIVIAELLGIPEPDRDQFRRWSDATIEASDGDPKEAMAAMGGLITYLNNLVDERRQNPGDDIVSLLVAAEIDSQPLDGSELFVYLITLLVAGNETTRTLISGSVLALDAFRTERNRLIAEPELLSNGVEELLRWVTPINAFCRTAAAEIEIGGHKFHPGDYLIMLYASANRDENIFGPTADQLDVARPFTSSHLAFGFGEHVCLGAHLARLETRTLLAQFLARYPNFEVTGPPVKVASTIVAGIGSFPVRLGSRAD